MEKKFLFAAAILVLAGVFIVTNQESSRIILPLVHFVILPIVIGITPLAEKGRFYLTGIYLAVLLGILAVIQGYNKDTGVVTSLAVIVIPSVSIFFGYLILRPRYFKAKHD